MKLLICDDDISTIDFIQNNLDFNELGITRILRAYNGVTAKDIITSEQPELIVCDIGMPQCNGIEVLKFLRESELHSEFAFLTCYESFEYAREAVRYGATNYLTKPLDLDELKSALLKMVATVRAQKLAAEGSVNDHRHGDLLLNNFLQRLRNGIYGEDKEKIAEAIGRHKLELTADTQVRCILVSADVTNALKEGWKQDLLTYSFNFLSQEIVADRQNFAYSLVDLGERFITITIIAQAHKFIEQELVRRCEYLVSVCRSHLSMMPVCLVGEIMPLYLLPQVAPTLKKRLHKIRLQGGQVRLYRDNELPSTGKMMPALDETRILNFIKERNKVAYIDEISSFANKIVSDRKADDSGIALLHHDLVRAFTDYLHDNAIPVRALFQIDTVRELDATAERSVFDMMNFAAHLYDCAVDLLQELGDGEDLINVVKRYIATNYRENIDRNTVAAIAYVTPNYLSKRFRSEVGVNMREYINRLRINEAKRLLLSTNASVSKIASDIGFDNISYFSTVFRKQCGMSPADWRRRKGRGESDEIKSTVE